LHIVAVQPTSSPLLTGGPGPHLQTGLSGGFLVPVLDQSVYDEVIDVGDELAYATARELARQEAMLVGASSGGVAAAALRMAARPESAGKLIIAGCSTPASATCPRRCSATSRRRPSTTSPRCSAEELGRGHSFRAAAGTAGATPACAGRGP
jgi:pimeloyl-ACP methyl ester carboxylesterase